AASSAVAFFVAVFFAPLGGVAAVGAVAPPAGPVVALAAGPPAGPVVALAAGPVVALSAGPPAGPVAALSAGPAADRGAGAAAGLSVGVVAGPAAGVSATGAGLPDAFLAAVVRGAVGAFAVVAFDAGVVARAAATRRRPAPESSTITVTPESAKVRR